ncbi:hypothetical protein B0H65DRAFT_512716 [Neurospora tetraspora]|uniref:Uncharacterized protein n=1 Tax=Neurospora tetraspora TaxID=94610 RepID=A0AAE0MJ28_9PEZI|nr:hypothetical protein B0H65DRAFT_512716 [Neurospora tetraspora]
MCRVGYTYKYCLNGDRCHSNRGWRSRNGELYPVGRYFERAERVFSRPRCNRSDWRHDTYLDGRTSDEYYSSCLAAGETSGDRWYYHR